jgi:hypothetical protein
MEVEPKEQRRIRYLEAHVKALNLKIECLTEELHEAQIDQRRYHWLKDNDPYGIVLTAWRVPSATEFGVEDLDKVMDRANGN